MAGTKEATESLPGYICESPLASGSTLQNSVEGVNTSVLQDKATCYSRSNNMAYRYLEDSLATPSGDDVILPADTLVGDPGRWIASWIVDGTQTVVADTFAAANALPFDVTKEGLVVVLRGLTAVGDGGGGTFTVTTGLVPDNFDIMSFTGDKSPYQLSRVDNYRANSLGIIEGVPVAIVIAAPSTPVEVTQNFTYVVSGPWNKATPARVRWLGNRSSGFAARYSLNFTGTPGDKIQAAYYQSNFVFSGAEPSVVIGLDGSAYLSGSANLYGVTTNSELRLRVRNVTGARNITPIAGGFELYLDRLVSDLGQIL